MRKGNSFPPDFWTKTLGASGLESPGYHEAVKDAQKISAAKKLAREAKPEVKENKSRKKK